jgi:hypothetical protein
MLKSRLQKLDGLTHTELKQNITKVITEIPKDKYYNIFKGSYERPEKYVSKNKREKLRRTIYKMGVFNEKRCKSCFAQLFHSEAYEKLLLL